LVCSRSNAEINKILPPEACRFLHNNGLPANNWKPSYDDIFRCTSPTIKFGTGNPFKNNLSYYVEGKKKKVDQLTLILNVNNQNEAATANTVLMKATQTLLKKITSRTIPDNLLQAISNAHNFSTMIDALSVQVKRENYTMNTDHSTYTGYELKVMIR